MRAVPRMRTAVALVAAAASLTLGLTQRGLRRAARRPR